MNEIPENVDSMYSNGLSTLGGQDTQEEVLLVPRTKEEFLKDSLYSTLFIAAQAITFLPNENEIRIRYQEMLNYYSDLSGIDITPQRVFSLFESLPE